VVDRVHGDAAEIGRLPFQRLRPALPIDLVDVVGLDTAPTESPCRWRPRMRCLAGIQLQRTIALVAADDLRVGAGGAGDLPPLPGFVSTLWTMVPTGMAPSGMALPGFTSTAALPETTVSPTARRCGARM
jgi:hypothetical protein